MGVRGHAGGGIGGLLELVEHPEYGEALAYDVLTHGLRLRDLGTPAFSWRDLLTIIRHQPHGCALERAIDPEAAMWGLPEQLLALIADVASLHLWADHNRRKGQKPKPIERPGVAGETETTVLGGGASAVPVDEFDDWLEQSLN